MINDDSNLSPFPHMMLRRPSALALVTGVLLPLVGLFLANRIPGAALVFTLIGSGMSLTLLLVPETSVFIWISSSLITGTGVLLLHALARAAVPMVGALPFVTGLTLASLALGAVASLVLWKGRWVRVLAPTARGDAIALFALVPVLLSTAAVGRVNGYVANREKVGAGEREQFHARGFVNGDTMTLFALTGATQERIQDPELLKDNPFAGNGPLEYPTLVHRALADVMDATGGDVTRVVWWLIVPVLVGTVAMSVLSLPIIFRSQTPPFWSPLLLLGAFGTTWESFTYPQTHTFLTGIFFLFMLLLILRDQRERLGERVTLGVGATLLALLLLFSNAVFGTAALAIAVGSAVFGLFERRQSRGERAAALLAVGALLILFFSFPPGAGAIGTLNLAYTAVPQVAVAAIPSLLVLWALIDTAWLHRSPSILGAAAILPALALLSLIFSARDIVAENSPRFLFLLVLLGWPALIPLFQRVTTGWWRVLRYHEHTPAEIAVLWGGGAFAVAALFLPVGASVAGTLDHLIRKEPLIVSADELEAFRWIRAGTSTHAVFLRAPESLFENAAISPHSLPAFTGRAQLRSEYWLSPDDAVLERVRQFFSEKRTRLQAFNSDTYVFCGPEVPRCPNEGREVYAAGLVRIKRLEP